MDITSLHTAPLTLPNGQVVPPRGSIEVVDWAAIKDNFVVKAWLDEKKLSKGKPTEPEVNEDGDSPEVAELRKRFETAHSQVQDYAKTLEVDLAAQTKLAAERQSEIDALNARVADLEAQLAATPPAGGQAADDLKAVHRGGGSYAILRGEEEVAKGLTKADADAFNDLSAADKTAYVTAKS